jgi:hypothetical protein
MHLTEFKASGKRKKSLIWLGKKPQSAETFKRLKRDRIMDKASSRGHKKKLKKKKLAIYRF